MAQVTKICKVCGRPYYGCTNAEKYDGVFRYQTVACSPECGAIYLAEVLKARGITPDTEGKNGEALEDGADTKVQRNSRKKVSKKSASTDLLEK